MLRAFGMARSAQPIESSIASGAAVALTTATPANVTSISLPPGLWIVRGLVGTVPAGANVQSRIIGSISLTSAVHGVAPNGGAHIDHRSAAEAGGGVVLPVGSRLLDLAATTSVYLVITVAWTTSTLGAYGYLGAHRV